MRLMLVMHYVEASQPGVTGGNGCGAMSADWGGVQAPLQAPSFGVVDFAVLAGLTFVVAAFIGVAS